MSLQNILNIFNTEFTFMIVYYPATFLYLTSMARLLETFGSKHVEETTLLDWTDFQKFTV